MEKNGSNLQFQKKIFLKPAIQIKKYGNNVKRNKIKAQN